MRKVFVKAVIALGLSFAFAAAANATVISFGSYSFDTSNWNWNNTNFNTDSFNLNDFNWNDLGNLDWSSCSLRDLLRLSCFPKIEQPPSSVPEPATLGLLGAGLVGLGLVRRRKQNRGRS